MFFHNYIYRIKCIVREKEMMFWTLLFPLILATFFNLALSNLGESDNFSTVELAVVTDGTYSNKDSFLDVLESVSDTSDDALFNVTETSLDEANELLENNEIEGYLYFDDDVHVVVKRSGINQTIIKSFVDEYKQTASTLETVAKQNPQALADLTFTREDFINDEPISKNELDPSVNFFYTLIAMTCMYGGLLGGNEITVIQANQSTRGSRISVAPIHKLKLTLSSLLAATTVQLFSMAILLLYLMVILHVNFASQLGYVILICIVGTITGITYGACISILLKKAEGLKIAILIGSTMVMSFLAGMMVDKIKYIVNLTVPILNALNPVNLIADSFYSLYYYDTLDQLFINLTILSLFSLLFVVISYIVLRRQKYASL